MKNMAIANTANIAKPYACAAYEFACENNCIDQWCAALSNLARCVENEYIQPLIHNPMYRHIEIIKLIFPLLESSSNYYTKNFVLIVSENNRLDIISQIYLIFLRYKAEGERSKAVKITTAFKADREDIERLKQQLKKKYECTIRIEEDIDPTIVGGVIIKMGEIIIDGSIRNKLNKMKSVLED
jgi:F-type H+-transporting ATPase subunit delta